MKRKNLLKLIVGVSLVTVMAISIPLMSGCAAPAPTPEPTPTPGEPTPEPTPTPTPTPEPAVEEPTYDWRIQVVWAPAQATDLARPFFDHVEEMSGGRWNIEMYSAGELMPDDQLMQAVQDGTVDCMYTSSPISAVPIDMYDMDWAPPFAWYLPLEILTMWFEKGLGELFVESWEELGGVHVPLRGVSPCDPCHLLSTVPVDTYEDLEGLKINAFRLVAEPFVDAGAISVALPTGEYYLSGQTGVVDGLVWCGAQEAVTNGWHEVYTDFLTNPINGTFFGTWIVNEDAWNALTPDLQAIFNYGLDSLSRECLTYYYAGEPDYLPYFNLHTFSDEDWAKFREPQMARWDEYAQGSPRMAKAIQIIRDYNAQVDASGWYR